MSSNDRRPEGAHAIAAQKAEWRERLCSRHGSSPINPSTAWGKAAERLRRLEAYRRSRAVMVSLGPHLRQVQLNALMDQKRLILPTPGLSKGFILLNPFDIPPQKRMLAIRTDQMNPFGKKIPYESALDPRVDLIVTDALAVGRDGSRLGDGHGFLDLQVAILLALGWLGSDARLIAVTDEQSLVESVPMEETDIAVHWIVTPQGVVTTGHSGLNRVQLEWERLPMRTIRRNDALFFLYRRLNPLPPGPQVSS